MQSTESAAASLGSRMLDEIDETNLEEILSSLRTGFTATTATKTEQIDDADDATGYTSNLSAGRLREYPIPRLDGVVQRHFRATQSAPLALTGRYHELLYVLIASLIAAPHSKSVSIIDFEGSFEILRLLATPLAVQGGSPTTTKRLRRADLDHVHFLRSAPGDAAHVAACVASMEEYMLYAPHCSRDREWWGAVVIGGGLNPADTSGAGHVCVVTDRKGWMKVERAEVPPFWDVTVEGALAERENRQQAVEEAGWVASSPWGNVVFGGVHQGR
ncbi:hypothetical protein QBC34DRAFT_28834 [Podospora aff. communis PSN243]|uniref:Uncharacterized protein n=1 Tax=Podospora aff. communis PSN243 TaxID=3040156 RepID=A0AAV9GXQ8_9PEZI|nr:hypothetical protein QBC34DRAFT_28834 [Podospora aff. communis PSN243]